MYNGRTDPVEHINQFKKKMAVHAQDEALMCRVFPSNLGPMAMRWFDGLRINSVSSFKKLTQAFCFRFITYSEVPQPLDSLLSMSMREGESVKAYSYRYYEIFNEIDGNFNDVAFKTFKVCLPSEHGLRKALIGKHVTSLRQLLDRVDKYKKIEDDQQQEKGKAKVISQKRRDFRSDRYNNNRLRRDYARQSRSTNTQMVNAVFRESVRQVLKKIKNEPFFKWPNKMARDPAKHNQSLYCHYRQEQGHTTEDCRNLWDHLDQLVREGKLKPLLHHSNGQGNQTSSNSRKNAPSRPPLGTINVIFTAPRRTRSYPSKVMSVALLLNDKDGLEPKKARIITQPTLGFSDKDKAGTIQPHDDALVVTLKIGEYDVRQVLVYQGSAVEIMYPDLY